MAATRLTSDSMASESRPTEPVIHQATVFMAMVTSAAAMESQAKRARLVGGAAGPAMSDMVGGLAPAKALPGGPGQVSGRVGEREAA